MVFYKYIKYIAALVYDIKSCWYYLIFQTKSKSMVLGIENRNLGFPYSILAQIIFFANQKILWVWMLVSFATQHYLTNVTVLRLNQCESKNQNNVKKFLIKHFSAYPNISLLLWCLFPFQLIKEKHRKPRAQQVDSKM